MPPACPVDRYARRYQPARPRTPPECHRLARWIVTLAATSPPGPRTPPRMPPACPVDRYARRYRPAPNNAECHRPARWIVTLAATSPAGPRTPPECHRLARWMVTLAATSRCRTTPNATGSPGGSLRSSLPAAPRRARSVRLHRASRWHLRSGRFADVATSVRLHRPSRWHPRPARPM